MYNIDVYNDKLMESMVKSVTIKKPQICTVSINYPLVN